MPYTVMKRNEELITNLCIQYQKTHDRETKEFLFQEIEKYCHVNYYTLINVLQAEREDVWQEIMLQMSLSEVGRFLERRRSTTFEAFFLILAKNRAYELSNKSVGTNIAHLYGKVREISEKYGIPVNVSNAHKFSRLLKKGEPFSINKVIYAIEGYITEVSIESLATDSYS